MEVIGINYACGWVQIYSGGRRYTCEMKEIDGEPCFLFKNSWHSIRDYASESLRESGFSGLGPRERYFQNDRDSISEEEFQQIVNSVLRNHPDVESYRFFDMGVRVTVFSRSGKSKWSTDLNFNDGGRITGRYTYTQSYDGAALPWELGNRISGLIKSALLR